MLVEAVRSVADQERLPTAHIIEWDLAHEGPAVTRNRALAKVDTEWVAFLDDDDELFPNHLSALLTHAERTSADIVYPQWCYAGQGDPLHIPPTFDAGQLRQGNFIPVTTLCRTRLVHAVGGFPTGADIPRADGGQLLEDWGFLLRLLEAGAVFSHLREPTWRYNPHGGRLHGTTW
jgi:glycosyltransferase involved in cell wall biosynthesis